MNYKKISDELVKKHFADEGMIAWGKRGGQESDFLTTGVVGANSWRYAITKAGDDLTFVPFSTSGIYFKNMYVIEKSKIKDIKVYGIFSKRLEILFADGTLRKYSILKGKKNLENIIKALGF